MRARLISMQQGGPDGLCGIYTLLNFLNCHVPLKTKSYQDFDEGHEEYNTKHEENGRRLFRELMHAAEDTGNLCAETICNGFAAERLKATYERLLSRNNLKGECRIERTHTHGDIFEVSSTYFNGQSDRMAKGIGVLHADEAHWILIARANEKKGLLIFDSSEGERSYYLTKSQNVRRARNQRHLSTETLLLLSVQSGR